MAQKQECRPKGPFTFLPSLKETLEKFEQDFKIGNLPEGKYIRPPPATGKWYNMLDPFEEKMQDLNRYFANIWNSPRPMAASWGKVLLQIVKELECQARQNILSGS